MNKTLRIVDFRAKSKHGAGFLCNGDSVTRKHLHGKTKSLSFSNGLSGVLTRGIEHGKHSKKNPRCITFLVRNTKRTETTAGEVRGLILVELSGFWGAFRESQDSLGGTLSTSVSLAL